VNIPWYASLCPSRCCGCLTPPVPAAWRSVAMERFEKALGGLEITDKRTMEKTAPFPKRFLEASQDLQRALTPLNASVHAAASRSNTKPGSAMTSLHWV